MFDFANSLLCRATPRGFIRCGGEIRITMIEIPRQLRS
jgi:hypothetical protein